MRPYKAEDISRMMEIWNQVVEDGIAFPQTDLLEGEAGKEFFDSQTCCGVAEDEMGKIQGFYTLHPNNIGRCGHICNASYAVTSALRGQRIGEKLVLDCLARAKDYGFRILQFNAVVRTNRQARYLYEKLGFIQLGVIPGGFLMKDGSYEDICLYYHLL